MPKTYFTCTTRERLSLPFLYYKNIEKHELLVFQSSASKFKYDDTLRLRPPSSRPNYLIYIFSRPASIVFLHVEIIARVKGSSQFSNPFEQSARADSRIGRRGKTTARITLRCLGSAWSFDVREGGGGERDSGGWNAS